MTDTTKLIQELRKLSHEKRVLFHVWNRHIEIHIEGKLNIIDRTDQDAPAQLQAAIDKVKAL